MYLCKYSSTVIKYPPSFSTFVFKKVKNKSLNVKIFVLRFNSQNAKPDICADNSNCF